MDIQARPLARSVLCALGFGLPPGKQLERMRVIIIDDHPLVRDGVTNWVRAVWPQADVQSAGSASAGFALARSSADVLLLDLDLPDAQGAEALAELRRIDPRLPVIVITGSDSRLDVEACIRAGARGYLRKDCSPDALIDAIKRVLDGETVFQSTDGSRAAPEVQGLTPRQQEILQLMCAGYPNKEIAQRIGVEESTVKTHVKAIFAALNVVNRTQAAAAARRYGWVTNGPEANS